MVIVVVPPWLRAGVTVTVRLDPLPPNTILAVGTKFWFEEVPAKTNESAGTMGSDTVKLIGPVEVLAFTVTSAIAEMLGGTMLLIYWARVLAALTSMVLRASGGILIESRVFTRRYMTDFAMSWGTTTLPPEIPSVVARSPLTIF